MTTASKKCEDTNKKLETELKEINRAIMKNKYKLSKEKERIMVEVNPSWKESISKHAHQNLSKLNSVQSLQG